MVLLFKISTGQAENTALVGHTNFQNHYENINKAVKWSPLKTGIRKITRDYIIPQIGEAFYTSLSTKYHDDSATLTDEEKYVIELLQDAIAEYAAWHCSNNRLIAIGDAGLRINLDGAHEARPPQAWEIAHVFWKVMLDADRHLDMALAYVEGKKREDEELFTDFDGSKLNLVLKDFFVSNTNEFHEQYPIVFSRRTFMKFYRSNKKGQNLIKKLLGKDLFDFLLNLKHDDDTVEEVKELIGMIQTYIVNYAIWHGLPTIAVLIEHDGIFSVSSITGADTKRRALDSTILALREQMLLDYKEIEVEIIGFLYKHIDTFELFKASSRYIADADGDGYPMDLGGGVFLG